jgi:hypothetical protein
VSARLVEFKITDLTPQEYRPDTGRRFDDGGTYDQILAATKRQ